MVIKEQIFDEQVENDEKEGSFIIDQGEERRADEASQPVLGAHQIEFDIVLSNGCAETNSCDRCLV